MTRSGSVRASSTVPSREPSSTRMISSTHSRGMPDTVAASVRAALSAGITTITFAAPFSAVAADDFSASAADALWPFEAAVNVCGGELTATSNYATAT